MSMLAYVLTGLNPGLAWSVSADRAIAFLVAFYGTMLGVLAGIIRTFGSAQRLGPRMTRAPQGTTALMATMGLSA